MTNIPEWATDIPEWATAGLLALEEMPLAECEDCHGGAAVYSSMHGCQDKIMCPAHWEAWKSAVRQKLQEESVVPCAYCNEQFSNLHSLVSWRPI